MVNKKTSFLGHIAKAAENGLRVGPQQDHPEHEEEIRKDIIKSDRSTTDQQPITERSLSDQPSINDKPLSDQPSINDKPLSDQPSLNDKPLSGGRAISDRSPITHQPIIYKSVIAQQPIIERSLSDQNKNISLRVSGQVAIVYEWFAHDKTRGEFSHKQIHNATGVPAATIGRAIRKLKDSGLLMNYERVFGAGVTKYEFNMALPIELIKNDIYHNSKKLQNLNTDFPNAYHQPIANLSMSDHQPINERSMSDQQGITEASKISSYITNKYNKLYNLFSSIDEYRGTFPEVYSAGIQEKELVSIAEFWDGQPYPPGSTVVSESFEKLEMNLKLGLFEPNQLKPWYLAKCLKNCSVTTPPHFVASWKIATIRQAEIETEQKRILGDEVYRAELSEEIGDSHIRLDFQKIFDDREGDKFTELFVQLSTASQKAYEDGKFMSVKTEMFTLYKETLE